MQTHSRAERPTAVAVFLSLDVQVIQADRAHLFTLPLLSLTPLLMAWFQLLSWGQSLQSTLSTWSHTVWLSLSLVDIGFKAVLYGVGL